MKGIVEYSEVPLVSSDIIGNSHSSIFDALSTAASGDGYRRSVVAWYDNEWGYSNRVVDLIDRLAGSEPSPESDPALVRREPLIEGLQLRVERAREREVARAAVLLLEVALELEHVAEVVGAGEAEAAVRPPAARRCSDGLARAPG